MILRYLKVNMRSNTCRNFTACAPRSERAQPKTEKIRLERIAARWKNQPIKNASIFHLAPVFVK